LVAIGGGALAFVPKAPIRRLSLIAGFAATPQSDDAKALLDRSDDGDGEEEVDFMEAILPDDSRESPLSRAAVDAMNVNQLKQQLRLRGLKVSGKKAELVGRLVGSTASSYPLSSDIVEDETVKSKARKFADERRKDLVDVDAYLEEDDQGKDTRTLEQEDVEEESEEVNASKEPETWGSDARIVDDYEGREVVVDSISRSVVEYRGSNQTYVQAFVAASRDALKPFLSGGIDNNQTKSLAEERLLEIQSKREMAARQPTRFEDAGVDEGDEFGLYDKVMDRETSDWGKYTQTGAQLSASEVQGVLLLSDVYGAFSDDTRSLAGKIAFECQPVVVMVPDLFGGDPWVGETNEMNPNGLTYEEWRTQHSDLVASVNIRAAAACLRERYGVSSVVVWGTCYGGGRALEAAAGYFPDGNIHDIDGKIGPPPVDPMAAIAWYPTRYNAQQLFGKDHVGTAGDIKGNKRQMAVMGIFAGLDKIPGATTEDAEVLKTLLEADDRVKDHLVKVFPDRDHGFAHNGLSAPIESDNFERFVDEEFGGSGRIGGYDGDAEVACLLSTAFMETYSRVFLPTVGPPISLDDDEKEWSRTIEIKDTTFENSRDVRQEIEEAVNGFVEEPLGGYRLDPSDEEQEEEMKRVLRSMEEPEQKAGPFALMDDDDLSTMYAKLKAADENFQLF
jgi:dienelactone hydrolase